MIKEQPIFVTGIPRSGTSIVAAAINQCNVFIGEVTKRSMYENVRIHEELVKPYLISLAVDPRGQYPLPDSSLISIPVNWRMKVTNIIAEEGYKEGKWMYKSTSMGLMWQVWNYAFPNAKWIIVRRKPNDIIQSCLKTGYMNAYSDEDIQSAVNVDSEVAGWKYWIKQYEKRFVEMITEGVNCKIIWPERMVDGDYEQLHEVLDWLDLTWKSELLSFIDPLLWKAKCKERRVV